MGSIYCTFEAVTLKLSFGSNVRCVAGSPSAAVGASL